MEIHALAIQAEGVVLVAEIAEAGARRLLVERGRPRSRHLGRHAVEERIFQSPELPIGHEELAAHDAVARRDFLFGERAVQRLAAVGGGHGEAHGRLARLAARVAHIGLDEDATGFPVGPDEDVFHPHLRRGEQLDRVPDAADIVNRAGGERDHFLAAGRRQQGHAFDRLHRRIQHAHGEAVDRAGLEHVGHVKLERIFRAFMLADAHAVQPDLGVIVHGEETQNKTSVGMRVGRGCEIMPIPGHTMVIREDVLDDPRDLRRLGLGTRTLKPFFLAPDVLRVGGDLPVRAVERLGDRGQRAKVHGFRLAALRRRAGRVGQDGKAEFPGLEFLRPKRSAGHGRAGEVVISRRQHRPDHGLEAVGGAQIHGGHRVRLAGQIHAG